MYYLGLKYDPDPYNLEYLDFYFDSLEELFDFAKHILKISNYEMSIFKREE